MATDPTHTKTLRRTFGNAIARRWRKVYRESAQVVRSGAPIFDVPSEPRSLERTLRNAIRRELEADKFWTNYATKAYLKGVTRSYMEARDSDYIGASPAARYGFLREILDRPENVRRLTELNNRIASEIRGQAEATIQQILRRTTDAFIAGRSENEIVAEIRDRINKIGISRGNALAQNEVIRLHAEGQLDAFKALGITEITIEVEWETAKDPCPLCEPMRGVVLRLDDARGLIPRHPYCRCRWTIQRLGLSPRREKRTKSRVERAIRKSLRAERTKATLWPGKGLRVKEPGRRTRKGR